MPRHANFPLRMSTSPLRLAVVASLLIPCLAARADKPPAAPAVAVAAPKVSGPIAARVNGHDVLLSDVDLALGARLIEMLQAQYYARLNAVASVVAPALDQDEAKRRGITHEELLEREVTAKVVTPSEDEIQAIRAMMQDKLPKDPAEARAAVLYAVQAQRWQQARAALDKKLYDEARVDVLLEPPRIMLPDSPSSPSKGPADAAVTIVEFADFQCTQCSTLQSTLGDLLKAHPKDVRVVFRQMPLQVHEHALEAAELSLCALDQGKFWPLHDWLFANQGKLAVEDILAAAPALGLDAEALRVCRDSRAHRDVIEGDLAMARAMGVNTTPLVLVNGRPLVGSAALQQVAAVVDEELRRAKRK